MPSCSLWLKQDTVYVFIVCTRVLSSSVSTLSKFDGWRDRGRRYKRGKCKKNQNVTVNEEQNPFSRKAVGKEIKLKINYLQEHTRGRRRTRRKEKKIHLPWKTKKICSSTKSNSHLLQLDHVLSGQAIFICIYDGYGFCQQQHIIIYVWQSTLMMWIYAIVFIVFW